MGVRWLGAALPPSFFSGPSPKIKTGGSRITSAQTARSTFDRFVLLLLQLVLHQRFQKRLHTLRQHFLQLRLKLLENLAHDVIDDLVR